MGTVQSRINNIYILNPEALFKGDMIMKMDGMEEQSLDLNNEINSIKDWVFMGQDEKNEHFSFENERKTEKNIISCVPNDWKESREIVTRAVEILSEWEETDDIRVQVQYAALTVGKIDNLKKKDMVHFDEVRNKICTLLRNVIRLNIAEEMFSKEQIQLLKNGFSMVIDENIQKEDMLQLNRKFRKAGLQTMPAWE